MLTSVGRNQIIILISEVSVVNNRFIPVVEIHPYIDPASKAGDTLSLFRREDPHEYKIVSLTLPVEHHMSMHMAYINILNYNNHQSVQELVEFLDISVSNYCIAGILILAVYIGWLQTVCNQK